MRTTVTLVLALIAGLALGQGGSTTSVTYYANLTAINANTVSYSNGRYTSSSADTSGVWASNSTVLTINNAYIYTTGASSSEDSSSFYGLNAGALATFGAELHVYNSYIHTTGLGGNGAFSYYTNSKTYVANCTIICEGSAGHGVDTTYGGWLYVENTNITTYGSHGAPLSNDRGGGTVVAKGGYYNASGEGSPCLYSTGDITATGIHAEVYNTEGAVIEGRNHIYLYDSYISGVCQGVHIYCSTSGDATAGRAVYNMTRGELVLKSGWSKFCRAVGFTTFLIVGTNSQSAYINIHNVTITSASDLLVYNTEAADTIFRGFQQQLIGNMISNVSSTLDVELYSDTYWSGWASGLDAITIDSTSTWHVTGASTGASISAAGTISLASSSAFVNVTGTATLSGKLVLPATAGQYTAIIAGSVSGTFSSVSVSGSSSLCATATYGSNTVVATVSACSASTVAESSSPVVAVSSTPAAVESSSPVATVSSSPAAAAESSSPVAVSSSPAAVSSSPAAVSSSPAAVSSSPAAVSSSPAAAAASSNPVVATESSEVPKSAAGVAALSVASVAIALAALL